MGRESSGSLLVPPFCASVPMNGRRAPSPLSDRMGRDRFSLAGRVSMVTGASRGLGRAITLALAEAGSDLVLVSRSPEGLERVATEVRACDRQALAVPADISQSDEVGEVVRRAVETFGRVDCLVNNAGVSPVYTSAEKITREAWDEILAVNLTGTFLASQAVGRQMIRQGGGKIINISSIGGAVGLSRLAAYAASKGGIHQLTRALAIDWARYGILVNAVAPAFVETDMTAGLRQHPDLSEEIRQQIPLGRFAQPEDVVGAVLFLASDAANYITGHCLAVDGGWLAH